MIIINNTLGTYGGSITLIQRMCTRAVEQGIDIKIYSENISNKEIVQKLKKFGVTIECFDTNNLFQLERHIIQDSKKGDLRIINFNLNNYLSIECLKKIKKLDIVNIIYSIHPATFFKGTGAVNVLYKTSIIKRYRQTIQKINSKGNVIFMDQDNIESTEKYYDFHFEKKPIIQALPMIFKPLDESVLDKKLSESYNRKIIFTSCRADFPFKGYLFGLIADFEILIKQYKDIKLCIVCSGDEENVIKIKNRIRQSPQEVQKQIDLHDWMSYEELLAKINCSYLYIGMGTGVLDAAIKYVPSIAVRYNTYENLASCIFYEKPGQVVADEVCCRDAKYFIEKLLNLNYSDYKNISKRSFKEAQKIYDVQKFFNEVLSIPNSKSFLSIVDVIIHQINTYINSLKKKNYYDVNNIKYEGENG